jgi:hypothetical protein
MTIHQFLNQNTEICRKQIIPELESDFTTLDFIMKFAGRFEGEYIESLHNYRGKDAFKTVHGQIARFLAENEPLLNIRRKRRIKIASGETDEIQVWEKEKYSYKEFYY